jgi:two-component system sensor histidine kinase KdpD
MLAEGRRLAAAGIDVVAGWVEAHGRSDTALALTMFECVAAVPVVHHGATFEEMDLDALIARRPAVALVDELAHANVPGSRHDKRWQDVDELLGAGTGVITTVNVLHVESLAPSVERITGVRPRETVPDSFVATADRVDLADVGPDVLRRRVQEGTVFGPEAAGAALGGFFNASALAALRDLATRWLEIRGLLDTKVASPFLDCPG